MQQCKNLRVSGDDANRRCVELERKLKAAEDARDEAQSALQEKIANEQSDENMREEKRKRPVHDTFGDDVQILHGIDDLPSPSHDEDEDDDDDDLLFDLENSGAPSEATPAFVCSVDGVTKSANHLPAAIQAAIIAILPDADTFSKLKSKACMDRHKHHLKMVPHSTSGKDVACLD